MNHKPSITAHLLQLPLISWTVVNDPKKEKKPEARVVQSTSKAIYIINVALRCSQMLRVGDYWQWHGTLMYYLISTCMIHIEYVLKGFILWSRFQAPRKCQGRKTNSSNQLWHLKTPQQLPLQLPAWQDMCKGTISSFHKSGVVGWNRGPCTHREALREQVMLITQGCLLIEQIQFKYLHFIRKDDCEGC